AFPHAIEPQYPGALETIVDITACWDDDKLFANRDAIVSLSRSCSRCHEYCCRYLGAAASLAGDTYRIALECLNSQKLAGYCKRLIERELKPVREGGGRERIRVFSAVTNEGVVAFTDSIKQLGQRLYLINDEYGAVSRVVLQTLRTAALAAGYDILCGYCPLSPFEKLEYLFIPETGAGFVTSNHFHDFSLLLDPYRIVNYKRFTDMEQLREKRKRLNFNKKAAAQMIAQAQGLIQDAKILHDDLEAYYVQATDFEKVETLTQSVLRRIDALCAR
ncbi:hypothetical protein LJC63_13070, partial [Ruminococcaceae bacterium OttesenSCG-928-L11]|nr:hypothetical protein [Ruminococcaceae bacterium OttesenSCG-928-L11]